MYDEVKDFMSETTYGGLQSNPLESSCYYCYLIFDKECSMYYSGVKTKHRTNKHGLLTTYFTTTSVTDFKKRLIEQPGNFSYKIEYFRTKEEAFDAERRYHDRYDVSRRSDFYNVINASGSNCGAGSVLCMYDNGTTYRVSVEEYQNGKHKHISTSMMNVYDLNDNLMKIHIDDFDPKLHRKELQGFVHALHIPSGNTKRIPREKFIISEEYIGITKGRVSCLNIRTGECSMVPITEFNDNDELVGVTNGKVAVVHKSGGDYILVDKDEYAASKEIFVHPNKGFVVVYDNIDKMNVRVTINEYKKNKHRYTNQIFANKYKCYLRSSGEEVRIPYEEFVANRDKYIGHKERLVVCRNIDTGDVKTVDYEYFQTDSRLVGITKGIVCVFNLKTGEKLHTTPKCLKETPYLVSANSKKIYVINSIVFKNYRDIKKCLKRTYSLPTQINEPMSKFEDSFFNNGGKYIFKKDYNKKLEGVKFWNEN